MTTSQSTCKLNAADWRAVRLVDRLLEQDLWIEETRRFTDALVAPPVEILATANNPTRQQLQAERFQILCSRYAQSTSMNGWRERGWSVLNAIQA